MTTLTEAARRLLDAIALIPEDVEGYLPATLDDAVIELRAALAQPKPSDMGNPISVHAAPAAPQEQWTTGDMAYRPGGLSMVQAEPVAWGWRGADGQIRDCIAPDTHAEQEGDYTVPLYAHPAPEQAEPQGPEQLKVPDRIARDVEQAESADRWNDGVPFKTRWERKLYESGFQAGWDRARQLTPAPAQAEPVAWQDCNTALLTVHDNLAKAMRIPTMPWPDPVAHGHEATGRAIHASYCAIRFAVMDAIASLTAARCALAALSAAPAAPQEPQRFMVTSIKHLAGEVVLSTLNDEYVRPPLESGQEVSLTATPAPPAPQEPNDTERDAARYRAIRATTRAITNSKGERIENFSSEEFDRAADSLVEKQSAAMKDKP